MYVLFLFKQKTAYEMRISDWSSDVCSSDLASSILSSPRSKRRNVSYRESSPWLIATTVISVSSRHAGRHATGTARRPGCDISNLRGVTSLSCAYMICSCHLEKSQSAPFRNVTPRGQQGLRGALTTAQRRPC